MNGRKIVAICMALLLLAVGSSISVATVEGMEITFTGTLDLAATDDNGSVTAVEIYEPEFGTVLVTRNGKGPELLAHVGEEVTLTGTIEELNDDSGYLFGITVTRYTLLDVEQESDPDNEEQDPVRVN